MQTNELYQEKELLLLIADGDEQQFSILIDHYSGLVYGYLLKYVKDVSLAQELAQDVFLKIWNQRLRLPEMANFPGYLFVTLRNTAINAFKEKVLTNEGPPEDAIASFMFHPGDSLEHKELSDALAAAIQELPPKRKEVFLLSRMEGLTYEEIATQLNIAKSTVRDHIIEALSFLRTYLKDKFNVVATCILIFQAIINV